MHSPRLSIGGFSEQYDLLLDKLREIVVCCPERLWARPVPKPAFWHEIYHVLYWCDCLAGDVDRPFERSLVGGDTDPRLFCYPERTLSKDELLRLWFIVRCDVAACLAAVGPADLIEIDTDPERNARGCDVVGFCLECGLLHGRRHVHSLLRRLYKYETSRHRWTG